ncbi:S1 family peptidase [Stigmatella erecta]|uniref:Trypsin-like peptidase domain-containing protein n=1 Tax=Stigmatella erecta TaxID=83460 RepID=A0A1I0LEP2_9BACT|nr:serine protease [Stigmatella erecta]SEU38614.1 hypothetical protein SAMN05443639_12763 [Stigmatella erecta]
MAELRFDKKVVFDCLFISLLLFSCLVSAGGGKSQTVALSDAGVSSNAPPQMPQRGGLGIIQETLMRSTFRFSGNGRAGKNVSGTAFVVGSPCPKAPLSSAIVLVTANHVLESIEADEIVLIGRVARDERWEVLPLTLKIRQNSRQLWIKHPRADVAVMYAPLLQVIPTGSLLPTEYLANDDFMKKYEISPGDEIFSLGYPFGKASDSPGEFPLLRSGRIASYPLVPTADVRVFNIDQRIFRGDSGGPVYIAQGGRTYRGALTTGIVFGVLGVLVGEVVFEEKSEQAFDTVVRQYPLNVGRVVHASLIAEAIAMLPKLPQCH